MLLLSNLVPLLFICALAYMLLTLLDEVRYIQETHIKQTVYICAVVFVLGVLLLIVNLII